jgi:hypothetical protein
MNGGQRIAERLEERARRAGVWDGACFHHMALPHLHHLPVSPERYLSQQWKEVNW